MSRCYKWEEAERIDKEDSRLIFAIIRKGEFADEKQYVEMEGTKIFFGGDWDNSGRVFNISNHGDRFSGNDSYSDSNC